ncbi:hypothetical protein PVAP13_1NG426700 [Panicum virgatum]|uniref:Uncharacterized protein n=1 Tax=Panicum virgatum TaxID=38727 RepID=A0A8T0X6V3_PANVG|nr:hypothetical protein PVAP13_1NG426700 [Panicum virgatum]
MEAYFLFRGGRPEEAAACGEQEEDIGSPSTSSSGESSAGSSSELDDDATSSSGSGSGGFEMSGLMAQLPFKRGLSRFFDGRSQSFASLAAVGSLEDLAKPPRKRLKPSRSYGGGLDAHRGRLLSPRGHAPSPPQQQQQQQRPASGRRP